MWSNIFFKSTHIQYVYKLLCLGYVKATSQITLILIQLSTSSYCLPQMHCGNTNSFHSSTAKNVKKKVSFCPKPFLNTCLQTILILGGFFPPKAFTPGSCDPQVVMCFTESTYCCYFR